MITSEQAEAFEEQVYEFILDTSPIEPATIAQALRRWQQDTGATRDEIMSTVWNHGWHHTLLDASEDTEHLSDEEYGDALDEFEGELFQLLE